ncbi:uncharacterized protein Xrcc2 [Drosophila pseudoobscura]|uniref:Uncharacterized protein Xrcc2 n=1 Tax=Drosophila pseudoobscura pseudoobscura TaxID=46245 RepID=A0A6I8VUE3_DROPS|nr:uncharacterized protein LOC15382899 [Drosophila pseudoobscura]
MEYWNSTSKQLHFEVFGKCGFEDGTLVEISGPSNSGKSLVMQKLIAHCLAPYKYGGRQWSVALISLSHKVNTESLEEAVRAELRDWTGSGLEDVPTEAEQAEISKECARKVKFINCFSTEDVINSLRQAKWSYVAGQNIELIALDTLSEFYWLDFRTKKEKLSKYRYYKQWQTRLGQACKDAFVCGMYTVDSSFLENRYGDSGLTMKINYSVKLTKNRGKHTLNGKPISFKDNV